MEGSPSQPRRDAMHKPRGRRGEGGETGCEAGGRLVGIIRRPSRTFAIEVDGLSLAIAHDAGRGGIGDEGELWRVCKGHSGARLAEGSTVQEGRFLALGADIVG